MAKVNQYLIEFTSYDDTLGVVDERYATGSGFITKKTETPSQAKYLPLVVDAGAIKEFLFSNASTTGASVSSAGKIVLNNASGRLNHLLDRGVDGRTITVRERTGDDYPSDFPVRFVGVIEAASFSNRIVTLDVRSLFYRVRQDIYQPIKYAGTNDGSTEFLEGTSDLEGTPKPKVLGDCSNANMPAVLVDRANEIYQLSSDPVESIGAVYSGRAAITKGTQYTTLSSFLTAATSGSTTAGEYDYYLGDYSEAEGSQARGCYVTLGTTPTKKVTFNAVEGWYNLALYSEDHTNSVWVASNLTVSSNTDTAPDNKLSADTLTATANNATLLQTVSGASATNHVYSVWLKRKTGTGVVEITVDGGATWEAKTLSANSYTRVETTPQSVTNPQFGVRLTTSGDEVFIFGSQCEKQTTAGAYIKTTATATINNTAMCNVWKFMKQRGYTLDVDCIAQSNDIDSSATGHFQGGSELRLGTLTDFFAESIKAYVSDTVDEKFICGVFKVPTASEVKMTVDSRLLLGDPKIKIVRSNDTPRGVPIYQTKVNWGKNYTVMSEADIFGVAELSDIPFVSEEWRSVVDTDSAIQTKHLNADIRILDTALVNKADATNRAAYEQTLYGQIRHIVEIRLPAKYGFDLIRGDVIKLSLGGKDRLFRVINRFLRFPSVRGDKLTTGAVTIQAWGGVIV